MVCTKQIQFWTPAAVTFGILYILCTLNGVLRLILGDRFILMCRSWYSGVDLIKFQGQSKLFSHIFFCVFSGIIRPLRKKKKNSKKFGKILQKIVIFEFFSVISAQILMKFCWNFADILENVQNVEHFRIFYFCSENS